MSALLWQPPQLSGIGHQDALWNAILTHARQPLPLSGNAYAVFEPTEEPDARALCTHIKTGNTPQTTELYIIWRHFPFASMLQASISVDDLSAIPPVLRDALIEGMTNLIAQNALEDSLGGGSPEITIFSTEPLQAMKKRLPADIAWFDINIENIADEPIALRIGCGRSQLITMAASQAVSPLPLQETAKAIISIPGVYTLGSATFLPRQLAKLTEGAVIVLPSLPPAQRLLRVDKTVWEFHTNGSEWILAGQRKRIQESQRQRHKGQDVTDQVQNDKDEPVPADDENKLAAAPEPSQTPGDTLLQNMQDLSHDEDFDNVEEELLLQNDESEDDSIALSTEVNLPAPQEPEVFAETELVEEVKDIEPSKPAPAIDWVEDTLVKEGIRLADLGITIDFDIGERDFTLAELETWQPGAVVPLDPPALQDRVEVTLRANGCTIATGDLIAIDDRLAVRLSKLLLRS